MSVLNPIDSPQIYDVIQLGGMQSPGICVVSGFKRQHTWDKKLGKGTKGGTSTLTGIPPVSGSIKFFLWQPSHWDQWELFRPLFKHDPTKKEVKAVDIYYPTLAKIDIKSVVCEDIGAEEPEGLGKWSITVQLLEYSPPPKATVTGTPSGSTPGGGKGDAGKPIPGDPIADAQQIQIAENSKAIAEAQKP